MQKFPKRVAEGIDHLAAAPSSAMEALLPGLAKIQLAPDQDDAILAAIQQAAIAAPTESTSVANALSFLYYSLSRWIDQPDPKRAVIESVIEAHKLLESPRATSDQVAQCLRAVLDVPDLMYGHKALRLLTEHDHVYSESQILTDIRPVFPLRSGDPWPAAVMFHNLRILSVCNGRPEDHTVVLDVHDLQDLKTQIERAQEKAQRLIADVSPVFGTIIDRMTK